MCFGERELGALKEKEARTIDLKEPILLLFIFGNVNLMDFVVEAEFLAENVDLVAVGCARGVAGLDGEL